MIEGFPKIRSGGVPEFFKNTPLNPTQTVSPSWKSSFSQGRIHNFDDWLPIIPLVASIPTAFWVLWRMLNEKPLLPEDKPQPIPPVADRPTSTTSSRPEPARPAPPRATATSSVSPPPQILQPEINPEPNDGLFQYGIGEKTVKQLTTNILLQLLEKNISPSITLYFSPTRGRVFLENPGSCFPLVISRNENDAFEFFVDLGERPYYARTSINFDKNFGGVWGRIVGSIDLGFDRVCNAIQNNTPSLEMLDYLPSQEEKNAYFLWAMQKIRREEIKIENAVEWDNLLSRAIFSFQKNPHPEIGLELLNFRNYFESHPLHLGRQSDAVRIINDALQPYQGRIQKLILSLERFQQNPDREIQLDAAQILAELNHPWAKQFLKENQSQNMQLRDVFSLLNRAEDESAYPEWLNLLNHQNSFYVQLAATALSYEWRSAGLITSLERLLAHDNPGVVISALYTLAYCDYDDSLPTIQTLQNVANNEVRNAANAVIRFFNEDFETQRSMSLGANAAQLRQYPWIRFFHLFSWRETLCANTGKGHELCQNLSSEIPSVVALSCHGLKNGNSEIVLPYLEKLLSHNNPYIAMTAAWTLLEHLFSPLPTPQTGQP